MKMMQYYVIQEDDAILHHTKLLSPNHYFSDTYDKYHQNSDKARSQIKEIVSATCCVSSRLTVDLDTKWGIFTEKSPL